MKHHLNISKEGLTYILSKKIFKSICSGNSKTIMASKAVEIYDFMDLSKKKPPIFEGYEKH